MRLPFLLSLAAVLLAGAGIGVNTWLMYQRRLEHTEQMVDHMVRREILSHLERLAEAREGPVGVDRLRELLADHLFMPEVRPFAAAVDSSGTVHAGVWLDDAARGALDSLRQPGTRRGILEREGFVLFPATLPKSPHVLVIGFSKAEVLKSVLGVTRDTALVVAFFLLGFLGLLHLIFKYRLERPFTRLLEGGLERSVETLNLAGRVPAPPREPDTAFLPRNLGSRVRENFGMLNLWSRNKAYLERFIALGIQETRKDQLFVHLDQTLRAEFGIRRLEAFEIRPSQTRLELLYTTDEDRTYPEDLLSDPTSCFVYRTGSTATQTPGEELCQWCRCREDEVVICKPLVGGGQEIGICSVTLDLNALEREVPLSWSHQRKLGLVESLLMPYFNLAALSLNSLSLLDAYRNRAITDGLTGLYNRRYILEYLSNLLEISKRSEAAVSLLMLDIDNFKRLNDEYGHKAGDMVLELLSRTLRRSIRSADVAGRYGGEEFVVVLPDTDRHTARGVAERIQAALEEVEWEGLGAGAIPRVTISVGVAEFPQHGYSHYHLANSADKALYRAKRAGKNRVVIHDHLPQADEPEPAPD